MKRAIQRVLALCLCLMMCLSVLAPNQADAATKKAYETYKKTGNQANDLVGYALSRVGKKDERGKMCAGFVVTCAKAAGLTSSQINMSATIASPWTASGQFSYLSKTGKTKLNCEAYTWKDYLSGKYKPQKGDLVFYGYIKGSSAGSAKLSIAKLSSKNYYHVHVGIIRNNSSTLTKLYTVDGGQSGSDGKNTWVAKKTRKTNKSTGAVSGWKSGSKQVFALEFIRPNYKNTTPVSEMTADDYLAKCTKTATYLNLVSTSGTDYIKTLPCSNSTCKASGNVRKMTQGEAYVATAVYKNTAGRYWYKVSASDGKNGFIYGGSAEVKGLSAGTAYKKGLPSDAVSGNAVVPSTVTYGKTQTVSGTLKVKSGSGLKITIVKGWLYDSKCNPDDSEDFVCYGKDVDLNVTSFGLAGSTVDTKMKFAKLAKGKGWLKLKLYLKANYTPDGKSLSTIELNFWPEKVYFTVK